MENSPLSLIRDAPVFHSLALNIRFFVTWTQVLSLSFLQHLHFTSDRPIWISLCSALNTAFPLITPCVTDSLWLEWSSFLLCLAISELVFKKQMINQLLSEDLQTGTPPLPGSPNWNIRFLLYISSFIIIITSVSVYWSLHCTLINFLFFCL